MTQWVPAQRIIGSIAVHNECSNAALKRRQLSQLCAHGRKMRSPYRAHSCKNAAGFARAQRMSVLVQWKTQISATANECQPLHVVIAIHALAAGLPVRWAKQPNLFVVTNGRHVGARPLRKGRHC